MLIETERKFLVKDLTPIQNLQGKEIKQFFLNLDPSRSIRVRMVNGNTYFTIKGGIESDGMSRMEWEKKIDPEDYPILKEMIRGYEIIKTRYDLYYKNLHFEVDIFHDQNKGLVIAELETEDAKKVNKLPDWIGTEVTGQKEYYNVFLAQKPFKSWEQ